MDSGAEFYPNPIARATSVHAKVRPSVPTWLEFPADNLFTVDQR